MSARKLTCAFITLTVVLLCQSVRSQLQVGFYRNLCNLAETIVKEEVRKGISRDEGVAAGLVRLHFHDCFVRVSKCDNAAIHLFSSLSLSHTQSPRMTNHSKLLFLFFDDLIVEEGDLNLRRSC